MKQKLLTCLGKILPILFGCIVAYCARSVVLSIFSLDLNYFIDFSVVFSAGSVGRSLGVYFIENYNFFTMPLGPGNVNLDNPSTPPGQATQRPATQVQGVQEPAVQRPSVWERLSNGTIPRIPLPGLIKDLSPGTYTVTGGRIIIGPPGRAIGVEVDNMPNNIMEDGPLDTVFNENLSGVLFELRKGGKEYASFHALDSNFSDLRSDNVDGVLTKYIQAAREAINATNPGQARNNASRGPLICRDLLNAINRTS